MPSINQVTIMGHLGRDPEMRYTQGGTAIANMTIATSKRWRDKEGEWQEKTEWHRIVLFGANAERASEHLSKGDLCHITGQLTTRKWQDKDGNDRYTTEVQGHRLLTFKKREDGKKPSNEPRNSQEGTGDYFEDDIPF